MKRVMSIIHYPTFGGPHNRNLRLVAPLASRGFELQIVLPQEPGNAGQRYQQAAIDVTTIPLRRLRASPNPVVQARFLASSWGDVGRLRSIIRERAIDVVLINGLVNPHAAIAARLENTPVVWQILDTRTPMALRRAIMPLVTRLADVVMTTGIEVARMHPGALSFGERLVSFFPPVETEVFRPSLDLREPARRELGARDGACLAGTVGNLNPQKGHEYLLRAVAQIRRKRPDVTVRVLGAYTPTQDDYARRLRDEARTLGLSDGVSIFFEPGARVAELLPALDVFVLASVPRSEGIPTAILEAMACGLPVVATDVGSVREVVEDGVTGYVVPPLKPSAMARAIERIIDNPGLWRAMSETARQRAVKRYDVAACADAHVQAFEAAITHHMGNEERT